MFGAYVCFIYVISISIICFTGAIWSFTSWLSQVNNFWKENILERKFLISEIFILWNKDSCCEHVTGGVNMYLHGCVSLLALEHAVCLWVPAKSHITCQTSYYTHQGTSSTKVPRLDMCRSIISLSNITHQMWHFHPFNHQRNKTTERAVGGGNWRKEERGRGGQNFKGGGKQYGGGSS